MLYIDCDRVSLGDETIRISDPALAHGVVGGQPHTGCIPDRQGACDGCTLAHQYTGKNASNSPFHLSSLIYAKEAFLCYQNKIKRGFILIG